MTLFPAESANPPPGFVTMSHLSRTEEVNGPFFLHEATGDSRARLGFRVMQHHLNGAGTCHGGVIAIFADLQGYVLPEIHRSSGSAPTITISVDFLAPIRPGDWVEASPETVRATRKMIFFQSVIMVGEEAVARCNGIYKRMALPA